MLVRNTNIMLILQKINLQISMDYFFKALFDFEDKRTHHVHMYMSTPPLKILDIHLWLSKCYHEAIVVRAIQKIH